MRHAGLANLLLSVLTVAGAATPAAQGVLTLPENTLLVFSTERPALTLTWGRVRIIGGSAVVDVLGDIALPHRILLDEFNPLQPFPIRPLRPSLDALLVPADSFDAEGNLVGPVYFSAERSFFRLFPFGFASGGALLSSEGLVVETNHDLLANFTPLGLLSPINYGLDAITLADPTDTVVPGRMPEVWMSVERSFIDVNLGRISEGDILSNTGRVVMRNAELLAPFDPRPRRGGYGLDALSVIRPADSPDGLEIWFSTERRFFSRSLNRWIGNGTILSSRGTIIGTNREILEAFGPHVPLFAGLDALEAIVPLDGAPEPPGRPRPVVPPGGVHMPPRLVFLPLIPEPATLALLLPAVAALWLRAWRRQG